MSEIQTELRQPPEKLILPCAGVASRLQPVTLDIPKEMLRLYKTVPLDHVIGDALGAGIKEILIVDDPNKQALRNRYGQHDDLIRRFESDGKHEIAQIVSEISNLGDVIRFAYQGDRIGTSIPLIRAVEIGFVDEDEAVGYSYPDDIIFKRGQDKSDQYQRLFKAYSSNGQSSMSLRTVPPSEVHKFGAARIEGFPSGDLLTVIGLEEKSRTPPSNLVATSATILDLSTTYQTIVEEAAKTPEGKEAVLSVAFGKTMSRHPVNGVAFDEPDYVRFDGGDFDGLQNAGNYLRSLEQR